VRSFLLQEVGLVFVLFDAILHIFKNQSNSLSEISCLQKENKSFAEGNLFLICYVQ
jgi:hypothetical protein